MTKLITKNIHIVRKYGFMDEKIHSKIFFIAAQGAVHANSHTYISVRKV